jgi:FkbM family methyltransferase
MKVARRFGSLGFLRPGIRKMIVDQFYPFEKSPDLDFKTNFRGHLFRGNLRSEQDYIIFYYGSYEPQELDVLATISSQIDGCVSLDVGCNTGQHTLVLASHSAHVYAFDPLSLVRDVAQARVEENGLTNVTFLPFGLGEETGTHDFYLDSNSRNSATGSFLRGHDPHSSFFQKLEIRNGDAWVTESGLSRVDLIKIDVEGFETEVLSGLRNTIFEKEPCVLFEISPSSYRKLEDIGPIDKQFPPGYGIYEIVRGRKIMYLFNDSSPLLKRCTNLPNRAYGYNVLAVPGRFSDVIASLVG